MSANRYKYNKKAGALQDAFEEQSATHAIPQQMLRSSMAAPERVADLPASMLGNIAQGTAQAGRRASA